MSELMQENSRNNQAVLLSLILRIVSRIEMRLEKMSGDEQCPCKCEQADHTSGYKLETFVELVCKKKKISEKISLSEIFVSFIGLRCKWAYLPFLLEPHQCHPGPPAAFSILSNVVVLEIAFQPSRLGLTATDLYPRTDSRRERYLKGRTLVPFSA